MIRLNKLSISEKKTRCRISETTKKLNDRWEAG